MAASPSSVSPSPGPSGPSNRHAPTAVEKQRMQLEKLLKDPSKPAYVPPPPKEKTLRPPREMMKNVQGSSAGAGSGEFHVYKASRRREYERLKSMDEQSQKEAAEREFLEKKRQWEDEAEAKTSKNRARRQKKKEKVKSKSGATGEEQTGKNQISDIASAVVGHTEGDGAPLKKRRLVSGKEMVFRKPGEDAEQSEDEDGDEGDPGPQLDNTSDGVIETGGQIRVIEEPKIIIHEDD